MGSRRGRFNGSDYDPRFDEGRLSNQHERVKALMLDGVWRTLAEIEKHTGDPAASISAQLRHLRKRRFGAFIVEKQVRGRREDGLFEYRLLPPTEDDDPPLPRKRKPLLTEAEVEALKTLFVKGDETERAALMKVIELAGGISILEG